jgi:hypothetical protein
LLGADAGAAIGSGTVGQGGSKAAGRIDGPTTSGLALPGDNRIREESSPDSKADRMINGICGGC